jgi:hypothetical protein
MVNTQRRRRIRAIRFSESVNRQIEEATRKHGHPNPSAFLRSLIENELRRERNDPQADERIAASFDRTAREIRKLGNAVQALFAFTDALARVLLHCIPEPAAASHDQSLARAKERHNRLLKMTALSMQGDASAALSELIDRVD